jgi:signal transduction histidine kinase
MPLPVALVDRDLVVYDASDAYAETAGATLSSLLGARLAVEFADGDMERAREAVGTGAAFEADAVARGSVAVRVRLEALDGDDRALAFLQPAAEADGESSRLVELLGAIRTIKHEINNPLTGALGNINLLLRRTDLDEKTRRRLATAEQEIKKASQIVLRLADLEPSSTPKTTPS